MPSSASYSLWSTLLFVRTIRFVVPSCPDSLPEYIVQGHRFNILENIGCYPAVTNTPVTYVVSYVWPVLLGLISATYGGTPPFPLPP